MNQIRIHNVGRWGQRINRGGPGSCIPNFNIVTSLFTGFEAQERCVEGSVDFGIVGMSEVLDLKLQAPSKYSRILGLQQQWNSVLCLAEMYLGKTGEGARVTPPGPRANDDTELPQHWAKKEGLAK
jgi:hypothetical protein